MSIKRKLTWYVMLYQGEIAIIYPRIILYFIIFWKRNLWNSITHTFTDLWCCKRIKTSYNINLEKIINRFLLQMISIFRSWKNIYGLWIVKWLSKKKIKKHKKLNCHKKDGWFRKSTKKWAFYIKDYFKLHKDNI